METLSESLTSMKLDLISFIYVSAHAKLIFSPHCNQLRCKTLLAFKDYLEVPLASLTLAHK